MKGLVLAGFAVSLVFSAGTASADQRDYDIPRAEQELQSAINQLNNDQRILSQVEQQVREAETRVRQEGDELGAIVSRVNHTQQRIQDIPNIVIPNLRNDIQALEVEKDRIVREKIPAKGNELVAATQKQQTAQQEYEDAQEDAVNAAQAAQDVAALATQAQKDADAKKVAVTQLQNLKAPLVTQLTQLQTSFNNAKKSRDKSVTDIATAKKQITTTEGFIKTYKDKQDGYVKELGETVKEIADLDVQIDAAKKAGNVLLAHKLNQQRNQLVEKKGRIEREMQNNVQSINNMQNQITALDGLIGREEQNVTTQEATMATLQGQIASKQNEIQGIDAKLQVAQAEYEPLRLKAEQMKTAAAQAKTLADQAKKTEQAKLAAVNSWASKVAQLQRDIQLLQERHAKIANTEIPNKEAEIVRQQKIAADLKKELPGLYQQQRAQEDQVRLATNHLQIVLSDKNRIENRVRNDEQDVADARMRVDQVRENFRVASDQARDDAARDASNDAQSAGRDLGSTNGRRDGQDIGTRDGREAGTSAGRSRAIAEGKAQGQIDGAAGNGYAKGKADGQIAGQDQAITQAKQVGGAEGAKQAQDEFMNANLNPVTIANRSAVFSVIDWERTQYYRPRPRNYPHPGIASAYQSGYRESFYSVAASAYDNYYQTEYRGAYTPAYTNTKADYEARDYSADRKLAYDTEKRATYDKEVARGFTEARDSVFNANYPKLKDAEVKKAYADTVQKFNTSSVIALTGAITVEENSDQIFNPGEKLALQLVVKNYGKQAQKEDVVLKVDSASPGLKVAAQTDKLVAIPGQSAATVTWVLPVELSGGATVGQDEQLVVTLYEGAKAVGTQTLNVPVRYTYGVAVTSLPQFAESGKQNPVAVQIKNLSAKRSTRGPLSVSLVSLDGKGKGGAAVQTAQIDAGSNAQVQATFDFDAKYANEKLKFEVQVGEGNLLVGRYEFIADTARLWTYNPQSAGLIVVNGKAGLDLLSSVELFGTSLSFDLWNTEVLGDLTSKVADQYLQKALYIPDAAQVKTGTISALKVFLTAGGKAFIGMSASDTTSEMAKTVTDVKTLYKQSSTAELLGVKIFTGNVISKNAKSLLGIAEFSTGALDFIRKTTSFADYLLPMPEKLTQYLTAHKANDKFAKTVLSSVVQAELGKEMLDDEAIKGKSFNKPANTLAISQFVSGIQAQTGADQKVLLELLPVAQKAAGLVKDAGRKKAIDKILEPLKKL